MKALKTAWVVCFTLAAIAVCAQGPLDPAAAPGPAMKSLDQIESRTPITSLPYVITQSGSYYLTGDLICSGNNYGIYVSNTAKSVTLDLNGFTLTGPGATGASAIHVGHAAAELTLRNGRIRNWNGSTAYAVYSTFMDAVRIVDIVVENCANGIKAYNGTVENCTVYDCTTPSGNFFGISGNGIVVINCVVRDCESASGTAYGYQLSYGSIARNCVAQNLTGGALPNPLAFRGKTAPSSSHAWPENATTASIPTTNRWCATICRLKTKTTVYWLGMAVRASRGTTWLKTEGMACTARTTPIT